MSMEEIPPGTLSTLTANGAAIAGVGMGPGMVPEAILGTVTATPAADVAPGSAPAANANNAPSAPGARLLGEGGANPLPLIGSDSKFYFFDNFW